MNIEGKKKVIVINSLLAVLTYELIILRRQNKLKEMNYDFRI